MLPFRFRPCRVGQQYQVRDFERCFERLRRTRVNLSVERIALRVVRQRIHSRSTP